MKEEREEEKGGKVRKQTEDRKEGREEGRRKGRRRGNEGRYDRRGKIGRKEK